MRITVLVMLLSASSTTYGGSLGTLLPWISDYTPAAELSLNNDDYIGGFDLNPNRFNLNKEGPCCPGADVVQSIVSTERVIATIDSGGITEYAIAIGGTYSDDDARPGVNLDSRYQVQLGFGTGDSFVRAREVAPNLRFDSPENVNPAIENYFFFGGDIPILTLLEHQGDTLIFQGSSTNGFLSQLNFYDPELFHLPLDIPDLPLSVREFFSPTDLQGIGATETAFTIRVNPVPEPSALTLGLFGPLVGFVFLRIIDVRHLR